MISPAPRAIFTTSASTCDRLGSTLGEDASARLSGGEGRVGLARLLGVDQLVEGLGAEGGRQDRGQFFVIVGEDGIDILEQAGGRRFAVIFELPAEFIERDLV